MGQLEALTQVPVTVDYATLEQAIGNLEVGLLEDGTAIGSGLATAVARLRKLPGKEKVILLLTDGENNRGIIDPRTALPIAGARTADIAAPGEPALSTAAMGDAVLDALQREVQLPA